MTNKSKIGTSIFIGVLIFIPLFTSCDKKENPVPIARFSVTIDLNLPDFNKDYFYLNQDFYTGRRVGVSGLLIVRGITNSGIDGYNAFERYCPYDQETSCKVSFDDDATTASCPCCDSQFLIVIPDGDVIKGPSHYSLKTYKTQLNGRKLTIYN